ncbi:MAG: SDR family NAD(P)-dependent oxidoreductase [Spirochaeta sp.]|nr:SDR family NAD(P)-dependent oxidoreductase [Spirochaeta sp.]
MPRPTVLRDRVSVVTGGAGGIGFATAHRLLEQGCSVAVWDLNTAAVEKAAARLRELHPEAARVLGCTCDVTRTSDIQAAHAETEARLGPVDILINNAGFVRGGKFLDGSIEDWNTTVTVNLNGVIAVTHALLPGMESRRFGRVVNISSASGTLGVSGLAVYAASKWAVWGLTESLRHEARDLRNATAVADRRGLAAAAAGQLATTDIRFSSVHPGYIKTGMFEGARIRGLGGLIVPLVKSHDVIARAVVQDALMKGKPVVMRPRSVRLAVLLRGILPAAVFDQVVRLLGTNSSMQDFRGSS